MYKNPQINPIPQLKHSTPS
ncbi:hypothetical protein BDFB_014879 [Asbolus verrucosus]|uniref:Uncharacterized protein n=1 Tax=Asbolus verrucosus TaxID=1661398 RepID=A0A482W312_ASBVE|nr:hypothetical protein BDFB_014879 [Asbolus verrucosus]